MAAATPATSTPPASPTKRPITGRKRPAPASSPGSGRCLRPQLLRQRIGIGAPTAAVAAVASASTTTSSSTSTSTSTSSSSLLHRLPAPALAPLATLLPTDAFLAAASADRACRALFLGEVVTLRLTAAPLARGPLPTAPQQIAGLLARCPSLRRLEGPFHHAGLQHAAGRALALLPAAGGNSSSSSIETVALSSSGAAAAPTLRRCRLWGLYAAQQPQQPAPALLEAAAAGRLPGLKRLDLGALGVAFFDDSGSSPSKAAAAAVLDRLGSGAWPALTAVVLGPGVYRSSTGPSLSSSSSLADGAVRALARRKALAAAGVVTPLEELRFQRLRDYGEEEEQEGPVPFQPQPYPHSHQQPDHRWPPVGLGVPGGEVAPLPPMQLQLRIEAPPHEPELEAENPNEEDADKENAPLLFLSPPSSPRTLGLAPLSSFASSSVASASSSSSAPAFFFPPNSPRRPSTSTSTASSSATTTNIAAGTNVDAGADWRVVEGALGGSPAAAPAIDPKRLRALEVTGGCARKSRRWGQAVARLLTATPGACPALRELVLTPDAAFGAVAAALVGGDGSAAPALRRLCLRAPEALEGGGATAVGCLRRPPMLPSGALRALGGVVAQGGLGGLTSLALEGAAEGAAVAALMDGVRARAGAWGVEELCLSLSHYGAGRDGQPPPPQQQAADAAAPLLALATCVRAGRLPSLRRLRLPVVVLEGEEEEEEDGDGGEEEEEESNKVVDEAWAELLGALAAAASQGGEGSAPMLEEVVLAVGEQQQDDGHAKSAAACLAGVVQGALPGVSVSWG